MFVALVKLENLLVYQCGYGTRSVPTTLKAVDAPTPACYDGLIAKRDG